MNEPMNECSFRIMATPPLIPNLKVMKNLVGNLIEIDGKNCPIPIQNSPNFSIQQPQNVIDITSPQHGGVIPSGPPLLTNNPLAQHCYMLPNSPLLQTQHLPNNKWPQHSDVVQTAIQPLVIMRQPSGPPTSINNQIKEVVSNQNCENDLHPNYILPSKELFKMPPPSKVVGFQQNIVKTFDFDLISKEPENISKKRIKRLKRMNKTDDLVTSILKGEFENDITMLFDSACKITNEDLYSDIVTKLKDCCLQEMKLNVDVTSVVSRIGSGSINSDVDLNISVDDPIDSSDTFLVNLKEILSSSLSWHGAVYIKSRVSFIRCFNIPMKKECCITVNNDFAMCNTELTKYFYLIQPECRKVVIFLKMLIEKGLLSPPFNNHAINLLVFFFFQSKGYLPKVMDLTETSTLSYWPTILKFKTVSELNLEIVTNYKELCIDLVDFYAHHVNFEMNVLSVFTGSQILKSEFPTLEYLKNNDCFHGLLRYMQENSEAAANITRSFSMAVNIEDPFALDHNVSRLGKTSLRRFKELCSKTYHFLKQEP